MSLLFFLFFNNSEDLKFIYLLYNPLRIHKRNKKKKKKKNNNKKTKNKNKTKQKKCILEFRYFW